MKNVILVTYLLLALGAFISCSTNDDSSLTTTVESKSRFMIPSEKQFKDFQVKQVKKLTQNLSGEQNHAARNTFTSKDGVIIKADYLTHSENDRVRKAGKGDIAKVLFVEIYNRGQMMLTNRTPMGANSGTNNSNATKVQVASVGQFFIDIRVNDNSSEFFKILMFVPIKKDTKKHSDLTLWVGNVDANNNIFYTQVPSNSTMHTIKSVPLENEDYYVANLWRNKKYIFENKQIGWVGLHKKIIVTGETASINVKAPTGYNLSNSAVYLFNTNYEGVVQLDTFIIDENQGNSFTSKNNWLPMNLDGKLLFMTIDPQTESVVYALKDIKVKQNNSYTFEQNELKITTPEEFVQKMNNL